MVLSGPPSPANMRVGSSLVLRSGKTDAVYGNLPGKFSCNLQCKISPHSLNLGTAIFGMAVPDNEMVFNGLRTTLSLTWYSKKSASYLFFVSSHSSINFLQTGNIFFSMRLIFSCICFFTSTSASPKRERLPCSLYKLEANVDCSSTS